MELHSVCLPVLLLATHPSYPLSQQSPARQTGQVLTPPFYRWGSRGRATPGRVSLETQVARAILGILSRTGDFLLLILLVSRGWAGQSQASSGLLVSDSR